MLFFKKSLSTNYKKKEVDKDLVFSYCPATAAAKKRR